MPSDPVAFPQDQATGLQDTVDFNDAANFAWLSHSPNDTEYIVDGFEITVDWTGPIAQVSSGVAKFYQARAKTNDHSGAGGPGQRELHHLTFTGQAPASGDLTLTDGTTNYVYIHLNQSDNDTLEYHVNATATAPPDPYLLVGTVDTTSAQEVVHANRWPTATFKSAHFTG